MILAVVRGRRRVYAETGDVRRASSAKPTFGRRPSTRGTTTRMDPRRPALNLDDFEAAAAAILPQMVLDYYQGGALDEITLVGTGPHGARSRFATGCSATVASGTWQHCSRAGRDQPRAVRPHRLPQARPSRRGAGDGAGGPRPGNGHGAVDPVQRTHGGGVRRARQGVVPALRLPRPRVDPGARGQGRGGRGQGDRAHRRRPDVGTPGARRAQPVPPPRGAAGGQRPPGWSRGGAGDGGRVRPGRLCRRAVRSRPVVGRPGGIAGADVVASSW